MQTVEVALLGATGGRPAVEFISGDGEKLALPVGLDDSYAFDHALARVGWVAVQVGEQVAALRDGNLLRPTRLPDVWFLLPAADPRLVVISRHVEREHEGGKECVFELVDADGAVLKSVQARVWRAVGE